MRKIIYKMSTSIHSISKLKKHRPIIAAIKVLVVEDNGAYRLGFPHQSNFLLLDFNPFMLFNLWVGFRIVILFYGKLHFLF